MFIPVGKPFSLLQTTQPLASVFIAMHHNATPVEELTYGQEMTYTSGLKDLCAVFFYTLIGVVVHAVIQEYILDVILNFNSSFPKMKLTL